MHVCNPFPCPNVLTLTSAKIYSTDNKNTLPLPIVAYGRVELFEYFIY